MTPEDDEEVYIPEEELTNLPYQDSYAQARITPEEIKQIQKKILTSIYRMKK